MSSDNSIPRCFYCNRPSNALQKCVQCKHATYCGRYCQAKHWPAHKPICKALRGMPDGSRNIVGGDADLQKQMEFAMRSKKLQKEPPKEITGTIYPRSVHESVMNGQRQVEAQRMASNMHGVGVTNAAPLTHGPAPSFSNCRRIKLVDALSRVNVIQEGTVVFVRSSGECTRIVGCCILLEDPDDTAIAITLQLYNYVLPEENHRTIFPPGSYLAVLEPYVRHMRDDTTCPTTMRCDNPQHVIIFDDRDSWQSARTTGEFIQMPARISHIISTNDDGIASTALCDEGNKMFMASNYEKALLYYSEALSVAVCVEQKIRCRSNRATTYAKLEQWGNAMEDARSVLVLDQTHAKMHNRLTESLLMAQQPLEALAAAKEFEAVVSKENSVLLKQASDLYREVLRALDESRGVYQIQELSKEASTSKGRVRKLSRKHMDYKSGDIECRESPGQGRGMFVKDHCLIPAFRLIVASKALVSIISDAEDSNPVISTDEGMMDTHRKKLSPYMIRHLQRHPEIGEEFYALSAGPELDGKALNPEQKRLVDVPRILSTISANSFSITSDTTVMIELKKIKLGPQSWQQKIPESDYVQGHGLWPKASFFNHSCIPNCAYRFIGDFLFIYTLKEVKSGEQLCIAYTDVENPSFEVNKIFRNWINGNCGFICQCERCEGIRRDIELANLEREIHAASDHAVQLAHNGVAKDVAANSAMPKQRRLDIISKLDSDLQQSLRCASMLSRLLEMEIGSAIEKEQYVNAYNRSIRLIALRSSVFGKDHHWFRANINAAVAGCLTVISDCDAAESIDKNAISCIMTELKKVCCSTSEGYQWYWGITLDEFRSLVEMQVPDTRILSRLLSFI